MSLYDDVVTDFPVAKPDIKTNNDIANWNNNNFKLLQIQVEAAKKRQLNSASHLKRDKPSTSIAPVIDLSSDKRCKPQLQLKKDDYSTLNQSNKIIHNAPLNQMPPTLALSSSSNLTSHHSSANELRFNTITGKIERNDNAHSIYANSNEEYDPMKPNDYEKLINELEKTSKSTNKLSNHNQIKKEEHSSKRISDRRRSRSNSRSRRRRHSKSSSSSRSSRSRSRRRRRSTSSKSSSSRSSSSRSSNRKSKNKKNKRHSSKRYSSSSDDDKRKNKRNRNDSRTSRDSFNESNNPSKRQSSAAFPPPISLLEDNNSKTTDNQSENKKTSLQSKPVSGGLLKAEKMMAKMGYKEGEGLGRNKQGMSIALQVEKTGRRSGRIIHEKDVSLEPPVIATPIVNTIQSPPVPTMPPVLTSASATPQPVVGIPSEVMKNMSKVILLRNMVLPGDVDDDLEAETKEECQKYGDVNKCVIYEMPEKSPDEAVRIFIEFKTLPSAIKALTDLNGRFFGGRLVKVTFYNLDKFNRLELADED